MSELIISVSGLRGVVGENLTPDIAARFACAYAAGQPAGPLVLARDGRSTGRMSARRRATSSFQFASERLKAWRRLTARKASGRSASPGMVAPFTSSGMTGLPDARAATTSRRT